MAVVVPDHVVVVGIAQGSVKLVHRQIKPARFNLQNAPQTALATAGS